LLIHITVGTTTLTQDGRRSICSKVCLSWPAQFLGKISMPLYLFHIPVSEVGRKVAFAATKQICPRKPTTTVTHLLTLFYLMNTQFHGS
jgi:peptidoglycan/LPS O-acetylase OafA/YrhL